MLLRSFARAKTAFSNKHFCTYHPHPHPHICSSFRKYFRICSSVCLPVHISIHLSICLSVGLYICLSTSFPFCCRNVNLLSACPSVCLWVHLSISLPFHLFVCSSICLSLSVNLSICLSVCPFVQSFHLSIHHISFCPPICLSEVCLSVHPSVCLAIRGTLYIEHYLFTCKSLSPVPACWPVPL